MLAALHRELNDSEATSLIVLLPEDADARDAAEAASWFLGDEQVALCVARRPLGSGLEPPPHSSASGPPRSTSWPAAGWCASAAAIAEGLPPAAGPSAGVASRAATSLGSSCRRGGSRRPATNASSASRSAASSPCGGWSTSLPTTGHEPLRIELFGDEIEQVRAFSPFTQRALRQLDEATVYPAGERRRELVEIDLGPEEDAEQAIEAPADLVPPFDRPPDLVWSPEDVHALWEEEKLRGPDLAGTTELSLPQGQPFSFDAQPGARSARPIRRRNSRGLPRQASRRRRVPAPRRGAAAAGTLRRLGPDAEAGEKRQS